MGSITQQTDKIRSFYSKIRIHFCQMNHCIVAEKKILVYVFAIYLFEWMIECLPEKCTLRFAMLISLRHANERERAENMSLLNYLAIEKLIQAPKRLRHITFIIMKRETVFFCSILLIPFCRHCNSNKTTEKKKVLIGSWEHTME